MTPAEALTVARAAIHASDDATPALRNVAIACGTIRPEMSTIRAIRAVIERLEGKHTADKKAWEANRARRTTFQQWKRTISLHLVCDLDQAAITAVSSALDHSMQPPTDEQDASCDSSRASATAWASPPPSSPGSENEQVEVATAGLALKVTNIEVTGMCCQSEVTLIQRKLQAMPGVASLSINLMTRQVAVAHDPEQTPPERLVRTLNWSLLGATLVNGSGNVGIKRGRCSREAVFALVVGLLWLPSFGIWARAEGQDWKTDPWTWTAVSCVVVGSPIMLLRALSGVLYQRTLNMFSTMAIATVGACLIGDFWEAATLVFFFAGSEWLQAWCVHHTADRAAGLGGLLPEEVSPADGGPTYSLSDVTVGAELLVKPGARMPVDGTVVRGSSSVDESMLTGEGVPVLKAEGARVFAGTSNQSGALVVRTSTLPAECTAAQLTQLVGRSQSEVGTRALLLDQFTKVYTLSVLLAALLLATVPLGWCAWGRGDGAGPEGCEWWLRRALVLTVISCPCSLVVAMPITFACGVAALARWGILVKSSKQMDLLARVRTLCVDKTGTLTEGRFRLHQMKHGEACGSVERVMTLASAVESVSSHPIAGAFLEFAETLGIEPSPARDFEILEGEGVCGVVDGVHVHVGSEAMVRRVLEERGHGGGEMPLRSRWQVVEATQAGEHEHGHAQHRHDWPAGLVGLVSDENEAEHEADCPLREACSGCAEKTCCGAPIEQVAKKRRGRRGRGRPRQCRGTCCHKDCCGKACCHTGCCGLNCNTPGCCGKGCCHNGCCAASGCCSVEGCAQGCGHLKQCSSLGKPGKASLDVHKHKRESEHGHVEHGHEHDQVEHGHEHAGHFGHSDSCGHEHGHARHSGGCGHEHGHGHGHVHGHVQGPEHGNGGG